MHDARGMSGFERARDLYGVLQRFSHRQRAAADRRIERASLDVLHRDRFAAAGGGRIDVVDSDDVGVIE